MSDDRSFTWRPTPVPSFTTTVITREKYLGWKHYMHKYDIQMIFMYSIIYFFIHSFIYLSIYVFFVYVYLFVYVFMYLCIYSCIQQI